ncbi:hypothetical protein [Ensifer sp. 4252]|uniref:hypothetical protein n=1 Tax=Ensifer sp. 4252 TaxID=3373915 RepID=UPI003D217A9A
MALVPTTLVPDLNPIETAFAKLKTPLRKRTARSLDAIAQALGDICDLFSVTECRNHFKAVEWGPTQMAEYLRDLTAKARRGEFSLGPVLMALLRTNGVAARAVG